MSRRNLTGGGSIRRREDGRFQVTIWLPAGGGGRRRFCSTRRTLVDAQALLRAKQDQLRRGEPQVDAVWRLGDYLEHWLQTVVAVRNRPRTLESYERYVRLYIAPTLGHRRLDELHLREVQALLDGLLGAHSVRLAHGVRSVLRAALNRAMREQLVHRNAARLTELPTWRRQPITPWTADQASQFLALSQSHRWGAAFSLLLIYGLRRGEALGLSWDDVDLAGGLIHLRQQLQRIDGRLTLGPLKTGASQRSLPLLGVIEAQLLALQPASSERHGFIFRSKTGQPVDPKNFVRCFHDLRAQAGLPRITVHHLRHTAATNLKNFGVPARDAQLILGHANITTTQQLYQHADPVGQRTALELIERQLAPAAGGRPGGQTGGQTTRSAANSDGSSPVTPGGTGGDRTHDTLLKRPPRIGENCASTSVVKLVRARANAPYLGLLAVKTVAQIDHIRTKRFIEKLRSAVSQGARI